MKNGEILLTRNLLFVEKDHQLSGRWFFFGFKIDDFWTIIVTISNKLFIFAPDLSNTLFI